MRPYLAFITSLAVVLVGGLAASRPLAQSPRFSAAADAVVLDVYVSARDGGPVPALTADDFLVLDDNQPQHVVLFSGKEERPPLAVSLVIDRSGSMARSKLQAAKEAALVFFDILRPGDLVEVIAFNERPVRMYPLGPDHAAARWSFAGLSGHGLTGLYEAVLVGLRDLERGQRERQNRYRSVLVILSDGEDTQRLITFDHVLENIRRSDVMVYAISFRTDEHDRLLAPPRELSQLAFDSGGKAMAVGTAAALMSVYREIGAELQSVYQVGFAPSDQDRDGRWRAISVRVPGKDVRVRARSGYYQPGHGALQRNK